VVLLAFFVAAVSGQACPMTIWTFPSLEVCNDRAQPSAVGTLYADGVCRTVETETPETDPFYENLPGTYTAQCTPEGQIVFTGSGCTSLSCRGTNNPEVCDFDITSPAALYARRDPPSHDVQSPSQADPEFGLYTCFQVSDPNQNLAVNYVIFGDCSDPSCQPSEPTPAPIDATAPPTPSPTAQPTSPPTPVPIASTSSPTSPPTSSPSQQPSFLTAAPTLAPVTAPPTRPGETPAPSQMPSLAPSSSPVVGQTLVPTQTPGGTRNDVVPVLMLLSDMSSILTGGAATQWETATAAHIQQSASRPGVTITEATSNKITQILLDRRIRRSLQEENVLQISFDAGMTYTLEDNAPITAAELVGDAFDSDADRKRYIDRLVDTDDPAFANVNSVQVQVEGTTPTAPSQGKDGLSIGGKIGIAFGVIAAAAISAILLLTALKARRVSDEERDDNSRSQLRPAADSDPTPTETDIQPVAQCDDDIRPDVEDVYIPTYKDNGRTVIGESQKPVFADAVPVNSQDA